MFICRVALARAIYAPTKYVLLDDPLSAVVSRSAVLHSLSDIRDLRIAKRPDFCLSGSSAARS